MHRRDMSSHLAENIQTQKLQQEAADKDAHITRLASELQNLDEEIGAQNQQLAQETGVKNEHIERIKEMSTSSVCIKMHPKERSISTNKLNVGVDYSDSTHGYAHICGYILPRTLHIPPRTIPLH